MNTLDPDPLTPLPKTPLTVVDTYGWKLGPVPEGIVSAYISGPIGGVDEEVTQAAFARASSLLRMHNVTQITVNPRWDNALEFNGDPALLDHRARRFWMAGDIARLALCDAIVMLPTWRESRGAIAERAFALAAHIPVIYLISGDHT
jgi:hypothetical protein